MQAEISNFNFNNTELHQDTIQNICHVGMGFSHPPLAKDAQITSDISIGDLVRARSLEGLTPVVRA
jgi:hypothetical protein